MSSQNPHGHSHTPYLEGGVLLHVPQQMWLLGCRVVTHSALELLPWKEAEDKVSNARLAARACKEALPGGRADSQRGSGGNTASCQEVAAGRSSPLKEEIGQLQPGQLRAVTLEHTSTGKGMSSHLERRALKGKEVFKRDRDREILTSMVRNMKQQHLPSGTGSVQSTGSLALTWRRGKPEH